MTAERLSSTTRPQTDIRITGSLESLHRLGVALSHAAFDMTQAAAACDMLDPHASSRKVYAHTDEDSGRAIERLVRTADDETLAYQETWRRLERGLLVPIRELCQVQSYPPPCSHALALCPPGRCGPSRSSGTAFARSSRRRTALASAVAAAGT